MGRHHALKPSHLYTSLPTYSPAPLHLSKTTYLLPATILQRPPISTLSVGDRIPGFKVSAAFLSSLHSNIFVEIDSGYESSDEPSYTFYSPPTKPVPSPLVRSMSGLTDADTAPPAALNLPIDLNDRVEEHDVKEPTLGEDGLPILKTFSAEDNDMRAEGLHIVADSIAQQRNLASRSLILHPITLALFVGAFAFLHRAFRTSNQPDYIKIGTTFLGVIMAVLGGIRLLCGPYIFEAERVGTWKWLNMGRSSEEEEETGVRVLGDSDEILLTKFGEEHIGAIIFRGVQPVSSPASPGANKRSRRSQSPSKHTKLVIRAWTVAQKYRRKDVGTALLDDAIKLGKSKGWALDGIEFAEDHANHKRILPKIFNGPLDKYENIARRILDRRIQESASTQEKGKKRGRQGSR